MKTITPIMLCGFLIAITHNVSALPIAPLMKGHRYDIGGYDLYLYCMGKGKPTVVIDAGLGDDSYDWLPIQKQTAKFSRVCVYDRAGYGWSDNGPGPRTTRHIAKELSLLLIKADIDPPFILVGHSFGGYNVRMFTSEHPKQVDGLILVDASHERQFDLLKIKLPKAYQRKKIIIQPKITDDMTHSSKPSFLQERAYMAARKEISFMRESAREVQHLPALPHIPLIVISRGEPEWTDSPQAKKREKIWSQLQNDLARLSPLSEHIFAFKSGHDIPREQPDIIVDAISNMIQETRIMN